MNEGMKPAQSAWLLRAADAASALVGHALQAAPYSTADTFRQLYEHSHPSVYRYIYSLYGGPAEDVEDLTAETFIRAWKQRSRFRGDQSSAVGWLITIARNLVIDTQRRHKRQGTSALLDADVLALPSDACLEGDVLWNEQQRMLLTALQSLAVHERELLTLRYVLGWQVKQIAQYRAIPENTVSVQIRRALDRLRRSWPHREETQ